MNIFACVSIGAAEPATATAAAPAATHYVNVGNADAPITTTRTSVKFCMSRTNVLRCLQV